ncbi:hypothetical protein MCOL2_15762 [Listeria fleischmannii FSL S10-1203]|uniref:Uncharacterized protein n=1 Tax=Listeria fleischmannii FSL S10-1203 TaxID=1265822 RepID=W7DN09_9LIST|nr:hypothetical protein MCOL2_15762 [Listeria fleischmannii FSL S10-1203]
MNQIKKLRNAIKSIPFFTSQLFRNERLFYYSSERSIYIYEKDFKAIVYGDFMYLKPSIMWIHKKRKERLKE